MWCFYVAIGVWVFDLVAVTSGSRTAFVEIVFCENTKQGSSVHSEKLQGTFAKIGSLSYAQGDVLQIHPFGLCNISNSDALYEDEWVGVVKLTVPSQESQACNDTVQKALGAIKKGAKAVIFDITDSPGAAKELNANKALVSQPVVIISGESARKLMRIVSRQKVLKAKISWQPDRNKTKENSGEYIDMVIFMTCFVLITITCFVLLLKIKWKQTKKESSLAKMAFDAVSKMESKKYEGERTGLETVKTMKEKHRDRKLSIHSCSAVGISCVICLEEFKDGQEIRIVSCGHEFHLNCVDPWLLTNYTCPLCMLNIVEREGNGIKTESRCAPSIRSLFQCCSSSTSLSSSSMVYSITLDETPNDSLSFTSNEAVESLHFNSSCTNSTRSLWSEHLHVNGDSQLASQACNMNVSLLYVPSPQINNVKDIALPVNREQPNQTGVLNFQDTSHWQISENRSRAIQMADLGIRKYVEIGDAV